MSEKKKDKKRFEECCKKFRQCLKRKKHKKHKKHHCDDD